MQFLDSGRRLYISDGADDAVREYTLTTAYTINTLNTTPTAMLPNVGSELGVTGIAFSSDATRFFLVGSFLNEVREFARLLDLNGDGAIQAQDAQILYYLALTPEPTTLRLC